MSTVCSKFYSQVSQVSILGQLPVIIFIKGLFYFLKDAQLLNVANDKTIEAFSNSVDDLITEL